MNQQESGSLREALEKLAVEWANMDCRVDLPENAQWGEGCAQGYSNAAADLLRLLAAHPVEPAREPSDAAAEAGANELYERLFHLGITMTEAESATRAALEAACRVDVPRPLLADPDGENALAPWLEEVFSTDDDVITWDRASKALFDLGAVRPMPTREQIAAGIHKAFDHPNAEACPITSTGWHECGYIAQSNQLADAVMDLLNGES